MPSENLSVRLVNTARHTWDLGVTAFGGPPVHFIIFKRRFVEQQKWVTQETVRFIPVSFPVDACLTIRTGITNSSQYVNLSLDQLAPKSCTPSSLLRMVLCQPCSRSCSGRSLELWECLGLHRAYPILTDFFLAPFPPSYPVLTPRRWDWSLSLAYSSALRRSPMG